MKVGNLKFDNSRVGSNSPKSFTILSDKFSVSCSSSLLTSTSIATTFSSEELTLMSDLSSTLSFISDSFLVSLSISSFFEETSEYFDIVGLRFSKESSNSDFFSFSKEILLDFSSSIITSLLAVASLSSCNASSLRWALFYFNLSIKASKVTLYLMIA